MKHDRDPAIHHARGNSTARWRLIILLILAIVIEFAVALAFRVTDIQAGAEHGPVNAARPYDWFDRAPVEFVASGETNGYHSHAIGSSFLLLDDSASAARYEYRAVGLPFESHEGWWVRRADGTTVEHSVVILYLEGRSMVIPYGIRWQGFVVNVAIYAAVLWAGMGLISPLRGSMARDA